MTRVLRRIAARVVGKEKAEHLWSRLEIIGDIALIKSSSIAGMRDPLTVEDYKAIGEELLRRFPYIKSVWLVVGPVSGERLLRTAIHLAGEPRSETIYREHGCKFKVDILRVFVTPRLNYEHKRLAEIARDGETIVNMFAGAGLFSIVMACRKRVKVYSIDVSEDAYRFMVENINLNRDRLKGEVIPLLGDAAEVIEEKLSSIADRVLEPYPRLALDYMRYALKALKGRGFLHVYLHVEAENKRSAIAKASLSVVSKLESLGWRGYVENSRVVRPVGPRFYQVVVDVYAEKAPS